MSRCRVCVAKIGGSLFTAADFSRRLTKWLSSEMAVHPDTHYVLIAGGGKLVEAIREIDRVSPLDSESAHWICIDLMSVAARVVGATLPELAVVESFHDVEHRLTRPGATILLPCEFMRQIEPKCGGTRLVCDWSVTSDAIAGRLATVLAAYELVLIKSIGAPIALASGVGEWLSALSALGFVDAFLPKLAPELPAVRFAVLPN
jgi:5-(aminomethyl)-3-furanmethanol phosphate kinase